MFAHLSVLENVRVALQRKLGTSFHFWKRESSLNVLDDEALALLRSVDLEAYASLPAVELSYGRKRALEIATTLAMEPTLMLLDEPTQGMGLEDVERVRELIRKVAANRTVLMVEHNMSVVASIADTITVLARGATLAEGPYAEVSKNPAVIEAYMGTRRRRARREPLSMAVPFLEISGLHGWYGESHVLHGVDLKVDEGEVVTLLGRNGAGRTSTLRAIMGLIGSRTGSIKVRGSETVGMADAPDRPPRPRLLPRRARHLRQPLGRGEPAPAAAAGAPAA